MFLYVYLSGIICNYAPIIGLIDATAQQEINSMPVSAARKPAMIRARKERVLVEFPENLLKRADDAAHRMDKNRSELIRTAVEQLLEEMEKKRFELELAAAYSANAPMSLEIMEEFAHVDSEGF
jgi:Arc/MetJ-type ribon-helix-helix transcriptional regulator